MALTSTLFTGLSGLNTNQTRMNVVGNNIANVNTTAFKASRVLFKPQAYITDAAGGPPSADAGGTNPSQRGLGATIAAIDKDFSGGSISATGKSTDMAVDGEGFFVVKTPDGQRYTRDGAFEVNSNHDLVTSSGAFVQGYGVDDSSKVVATKVQNINVPIGAQIAAKSTGKMDFVGNLDASGALATNASGYFTQPIMASGGGVIDPTTLLTSVEAISAPFVPLFSTAPGSNMLTLTGKVGADPVPPATFTVTGTSTVQDLMDFFDHSLGIDKSLVGPPAAGAAVDPTGTMITLTGNVGEANKVSLDVNSLVSNGGTRPLLFSADPAMVATGASTRTSAIAHDSLGQQITIDISAALESRNASGGTTWRFIATSPDNKGPNGLVLGNGTLTFDATGRLTATTGATITVDRQGTGASPSLPIQLDFGGLSSLSQTMDMKLGKEDGYAAGSLTDFSIGTDGTITGAYSNGQNRTLGQVVLAKFNNANGLVDEGGNLFASGSNSGLPQIGAANTLGTGAIRGQSLELSNVDLSNEFINLIIASTGFTAASRVITTSNQLLTELLNTSR